MTECGFKAVFAGILACVPDEHGVDSWTLEEVLEEHDRIHKW